MVAASFPNGGPEPSTEVTFGTSVTIRSWPTYQDSQTTALPYKQLDMQFTPDPTNLPPRFQCVQYTQCRYVAYRSGTFDVTGWVNGAVLTRQLHVRVIRRQLTLSVAPSAVAPGDLVSFTANSSGASIGAAPTWAISDSTAVSGSTCKPGAWTCTEIARKSYTRTVTAKLDDSLQTVSASVYVRTGLAIAPSTPAPIVGEVVTFSGRRGTDSAIVTNWRLNNEEQPSCASQVNCSVHVDSAGSYVISGQGTSQQLPDDAIGGVLVPPSEDPECTEMASLSDGSALATAAFCGDEETGLEYVAPDYYKKPGDFKLVYTDKDRDEDHFFTLHGASFEKIREVKKRSTTRGVYAMYRIVGWDSYSSDNYQDTLFYVNIIPILSTLVQTTPSDFTGGFVQWGEAGGFYYKPGALR